MSDVEVMKAPRREYPKHLKMLKQPTFRFYADSLKMIASGEPSKEEECQIFLIIVLCVPLLSR